MHPLVNRMAVIVRPKRPFIDWANSFDDLGDMGYEDCPNEPGCYLIDEAVDISNQSGLLRKHWKHIFEQELHSWRRQSKDWPGKRTYEQFEAWFEVEVSSMIFDLGREELLAD